MKRNKIILLLAACVVVMGISFLPVKIPFVVKSVAKILPARQWILSRGNDGEILANTKNNISGINYSSKLFSFERGESIILNIDPLLENGKMVKEGDTLGIIYSTSQQENLVKLKGELQVLTATLHANEAGEKQAIVQEARERLAQAKVEFEKQNKIVARLTALYDKKLVAEAEYQTEFDELTVLSKAVDIRQAELQSSLSGQKVEDINMLKEQIAAVQNELNFLEQEIDSYNVITAPFNGRIERSFSSDTLFVLSNIDAGIAFMPVEIEKAAFIEADKRVTFYLNDTVESLSGHIQMKQPVMQLVDGKQCIIVLATVKNLSNNFISGIISPAEINCGSIPIHTFIKRNIKR